MAKTVKRIAKKAVKRVGAGAKSAAATLKTRKDVRRQGAAGVSGGKSVRVRPIDRSKGEAPARKRRAKPVTLDDQLNAAAREYYARRGPVGVAMDAAESTPV